MFQKRKNSFIRISITNAYHVYVQRERERDLERERERERETDPIPTGFDSDRKLTLAKDLSTITILKTTQATSRMIMRNAVRL